MSVSITSAQAIALRTVRVVFSGAVTQVDSSAAGDALNPANWSVAATTPVGGLVPSAVTAVASVASVSTTTVDLEADTDLSPGMPYRVSATGITGLAISPSTRDFSSFSPPAPVGRAFQVAKMIPRKFWDEDDSGDLARFVACLQDGLTTILHTIDRWTDIIDPERAPERFVDAMLADMGNPFRFASLSLVDKRRLLLSLKTIYSLKGTVVGIRAAINFFTGLDTDIIAFGGVNGAHLGPTGDNHLGPTGTTFIIGSPDSSCQLSLKIGVPYQASNWAATPEQLLRIMTVIRYMKPANMILQPALCPRLPAPKNPTISTTSGHFTVAWSAVTGASGGYHVYWGNTAEVNYRNGTQVTAAGTSTVIAAASGSMVYAVVVGIDNGSGAGESGASDGVMSDVVSITVA